MDHARSSVPPALVLSVQLALVACSTAKGPQTYPPPPQDGVSERLHGLTVRDPYRSLEALDSRSTWSWARAQDALTEARLEDGPLLSRLEAEQQALATMVRYGVPTVAGGRLFYRRWSGSTETAALLVREGEEAGETVLVDPPGEGLGALRTWAPSPDGRWLAYGTAPVGSRWARLRIRDVATGRDLPDEIGGIWSPYGRIAWSRDGSGFFYLHFEEPEPGRDAATGPGVGTLRYHRLGSSVEADPALFEPEDESWVYLPSVTEDGELLVLVGYRRNENRVLVAPLGGGVPRLRPVPGLEGGAVSFLARRSGRLLVLTDLGAPRGRIVSVDPDDPAGTAWREVIPESEATLVSATVIGEQVLALYREDARARLERHALAGPGGGDVPLPSVGWIGAISGPESGGHAYYSISGLTDPSTVYRLDLATGRSSAFRRPELPFAPEDFVTRQVFYRSADGTRVPMFLAHRRDLDLASGAHPVWLYGYGAFAWPAVPWFQPPVVSWMELGGVYALANVRGGGEYGREWYEAGVGRRKQTSIDDFLAAAEHLVAEGVTRPDLLVAHGGSASGPLVGAAIVQRPDLFGAALVDVPVLDMVRFPRAPGGERWTPEFGDPADPEDLRALHRYSPYHNVRPETCYPATLVTAGEEDQAAPPWHAFKFVAALQAAQSCSRPVLLQVAWGAGHALGKDPESIRASHVRQLAFLAAALGFRELAGVRDDLSGAHVEETGGPEDGGGVAGRRRQNRGRDQE